MNKTENIHFTQDGYDKLQEEQYANIREQVKQELYEQMMSGRRPYSMSDPFAQGGPF